RGRAVHALHVIGGHGDLGAIGQPLVAGVGELFLDDPLVIGDGVSAADRGVVDRVGVGVVGADDGGGGAVHAFHVICGEGDVGADGVFGVGGFGHAFGHGSAVGGMLHAVVAAMVAVGVFA